MSILDVTGDQFTGWILAILGNIFIVILVIRCFGDWIRKDWGALVGDLVMGIIIAALVYFPTQFIGLLKGAWKLFTGQEV